MTNRKYVLFGVGLALAAAASACDNSNLTNLNQDPNNPTDVPAASLFTRAVNVGTQRFLGSGFDLRGTEFLAQHLAEVQYPDEDRYTRLNGGSTTGYFDQAYYTELKDLTQAILKGKAANAPGTWGPATVFQIWIFENLTDTWGDVPYTTALKGDSGNVTPTYDPQQQIYTSFFARLDSVSKALVGATNTLRNADPLYAGNLTEWQKFANSLRARLAMRIVNVDPTTARAQFEAAVNAPGGLMTSNSDIAEVSWPADGIYDNPWSINFQTRDDHRISDRLTGVMNPINDPRVAVYAQPAQSSGNYVGQPNGLTSDSAGKWLNVASRPGTIFMPQVTSYATFPSGTGPSTPSFIMTYAEVELLLAEAAERGWTVPGTAASHYGKGIAASMEQWGLPASDTVAYLAQPAVAYKGGASGLAQIAVQKWIALFSDGTQAWASWRRTCQPTDIKAGPAAVSSTLPRRFQYSTTEISTNSDAVNAAIARQGADAFATRVWWDTNPTAAPTYVDATTCNGTKGP